MVISLVVVLLTTWYLCAQIGQGQQNLPTNNGFIGQVENPVVVEQSNLDPAYREIIAELLKRSRLLEDVKFTVPRAIWTEYLLKEIKGEGDLPPESPVGVIVKQGDYELEIDKNRELAFSARIEVQVLSPKPVRPLDILPSTMAWNDIRISMDGKKAEATKLPVSKGFFRFSPPTKGVYVITATCKPAYGSGKLRMNIIPTTISNLKFNSPRSYHVSVDSSPVTVTGNATRGTHGSIPMLPGGTLAINYSAPRKFVDPPARYKLHGNVAWNLGADVQNVTAAIRVAIIRGRTDSLQLSIPPNADRVSITGPDVREVRGSRVFLHSKITGQTLLNVTWEQPVSKGSSARLSRPDISEATWESGTLVVTNTAGGSELMAESTNGLKEIPLVDIPSKASAILRGKAVLAYSIQSRYWSPRIEKMNIGEFDLQETIADTAEFQFNCRRDGNVICSAQYDIRNRNRQFLCVTLPPRAQILIARVDEKSTPITSLSKNRNEYLLGLKRSTASMEGLVSFPVQIVYTYPSKPLTNGMGEVELPKIDAPIAYAWCNGRLPRTLAELKVSGPMQNVEFFSSETATSEMGYGQAVAATKKPKKIPVTSGLKRPRVQKINTRLLAPNYWRAGKDFYQRGDYSRAKESLTKAIRMAPKSQVAANANRLLSNIKLLSGKLNIKGKSQKLSAKKVMQNISEKNRKLSSKQRFQIEEGKKALIEGRTKEAQSRFQAAQILSDELIAKGAKSAEQEALLREVRHEVTKAKTLKLSRMKQELKQMKQFRKEGKLKDASKLADKLNASKSEGIIIENEEFNRDIQEELDEIALDNSITFTSQRANDGNSGRWTIKPVSNRNSTIGGPLDFVRGVFGERTGSPAKPVSGNVAPEPQGPTQDSEIWQPPAEQSDRWNSDTSHTRNTTLTSIDGGRPLSFVRGIMGELTHTDVNAQGVPSKPMVQTYDIRDLQNAGLTNTEDYKSREKDLKRNKAKLMRQAESVLRSTGNRNATVKILNGMIQINANQSGQEAFKNLTDNLRKARGGQIMKGRNFAKQQDAQLDQPGNTMPIETPETVEPDLTTNNPLLQEFISKNYKWDDGRNMKKLSQSLTYNWGQKSQVASININAKGGSAEELGIRFHDGNNDVRYTTIDEAQFRTLMDLDATKVRNRYDNNSSNQDTIIGTDAQLANGWFSNVTFAGDKRNTLDINDNPIALKHDRYILIDNGGYLTAVRSGAMQHWTTESKAIEFQASPQNIEIPQTGQLIKLEKKLIKPTDRLIVRFSYNTKG